MPRLRERPLTRASGDEHVLDAGARPRCGEGLLPLLERHRCREQCSEIDLPLLDQLLLTIIWLRTLRGHFTPTRHFGFEAVAWYWHFVDVVWLGLFIFVYWV